MVCPSITVVCVPIGFVVIELEEVEEVEESVADTEEEKEEEEEEVEEVVELWEDDVVDDLLEDEREEEAEEEAEEEDNDKDEDVRELLMEEEDDATVALLNPVSDGTPPVLVENPLSLLLKEVVEERELAVLLVADVSAFGVANVLSVVDDEEKAEDAVAKVSNVNEEDIGVVEDMEDDEVVDEMVLASVLEFELVMGKEVKPPVSVVTPPVAVEELKDAAFAELVRLLLVLVSVTVLPAAVAAIACAKAVLKN